MKLNSSNTLYLPKIKLNTRHKKLFSGYRDVTFFKNHLPLTIKKNKLTYRNAWKSGRASSGRVVMWTRSSLKKRFTKTTVNYSFRSLKLGFVSSISLSSSIMSPVSLYQLSDGSYTYLRPTTTTKLFTLSRMDDIFKSVATKSQLTMYLTFLYSNLIIKPSLFILWKLPRNQNISLLELYPNKKIQYVRAPGSKSKMLKMDTRTNTAVIKLPSGVKKVFSIYSLASFGQVLFPDKKLFKNNKAGYNNSLGKKPIVRGVAMNPVDHPHGGRAKSIKYQRTPWGKTTKFK